MPITDPLRALGTAGLALWSIAALTSPASAVEWSLLGNLEQRFEADDNILLVPDPEGGVAGSITDLSLTFLGETKRTVFSLEAGVDARGFVGPGDPGTLDSVNPRFEGSFKRFGKLFEVDGALSFQSSPAAFAQIEDTGVTDQDTTQLEIDAELGVSHDLDSRNRLSLRGDAGVDEFTDGSTNLTPTRSFGGDLSWQRQMSDNVAGTLTIGVSRFAADNATDTTSLTYDALGEVAIDVNSRLSFSVGAGVSVTEVEQTVMGATTSETSIGALGNLGARYAGDQTTLGVLFSQSVVPTAEGELDNMSSVTFDINHAISRRTNFVFDSGVSYRTALSGFDTAATGGDRLFFFFSPQLTYQIAGEWQAGVGYEFRLDNDDLGTGVSNSVFVRISRDFVLVP